MTPDPNLPPTQTLATTIRTMVELGDRACTLLDARTAESINSESHLPPEAPVPIPPRPSARRAPQGRVVRPRRFP
jgi:hypothetical protein